MTSGENERLWLAGAAPGAGSCRDGGAGLGLAIGPGQAGNKLGSIRTRTANPSRFARPPLTSSSEPVSRVSCGGASTLWSSTTTSRSGDPRSVRPALRYQGKKRRAILEGDGEVNRGNTYAGMSTHCASSDTRSSRRIANSRPALAHRPRSRVHRKTTQCRSETSGMGR
jgi:hypothetical protein